MSLNRRQFIRLAGLGLGGVLLSPQGVKASGGGDAENGVAMLYDTTMCVGCKACQNACKAWNGNPAELDPTGLYDAPLELSGDTWTLIQLYEGDGEQSFVKLQCMHCLEPACVSACPVHALTKTPEGPVTYDPTRCIGCRYCMLACPFNVPRFEWDETLPKVTKCTFCKDRLAAGDGPACVEACPTGALIWGTRGDLLAEARQRMADDPGRYEDHVYGEEEAGGTSVLYLSHVDHAKLGLPEVGTDPIPAFSENTGLVILPTLFVGAPLIMAGAYYLTSRRAKEE